MLNDENKGNDENDPSFSLPSGANIFHFQVAGHFHGEGKTKYGILKHSNGDILKPLIEGDVRSTRELAFYKKLFENSDASVLHLRSFVPEFKGTWTGEANGKSMRYLCLEDVSEKFRKPCILDVKIGARTYDPEASTEKIERAIKKYQRAEEVGFRILGMKVFRNGYVQLGKEFGKQQTPDTILSALGQYLSPDAAVNASVLSGFVHALTEIGEWFERQRSFAFYSSSLLFVYEGDPAPWGAPRRWTHGQGGCCELCNLPLETCTELRSLYGALYRVVMIDFAHVFPSTVEDANYIYGLNSLVVHLKQLSRNVLEML